MHIGVDLDNTIICYDGLFARAAARLELPGIASNATKSEVRSQLRAAGREDDWTRLQGVVYGQTIAEAQPYPGCLEFFRAARQRGWTLHIVSHRTRQPYLGTPHDLHAAARSWLEQSGLVGDGTTQLPAAEVYLETTRAAKHQRIAQLSCRMFVDDLPEFLQHAEFPAGVEPILFDPQAVHESSPSLARITSWTELGRRVLDPLWEPA